MISKLQVGIAALAAAMAVSACHADVVDNGTVSVVSYSGAVLWARTTTLTLDANSTVAPGNTPVAKLFKVPTGTAANVHDPVWQATYQVPGQAKNGNQVQPNTPPKFTATFTGAGNYPVPTGQSVIVWYFKKRVPQMGGGYIDVDVAAFNP